MDSRLRGDSRCIIDSNEIRPKIFATKNAQGIVQAWPGHSMWQMNASCKVEQTH
jgi:hypothetical protein